LDLKTELAIKNLPHLQTGPITILRQNFPPLLSLLIDRPIQKDQKFKVGPIRPSHIGVTDLKICSSEVQGGLVEIFCVWMQYAEKLNAVGHYARVVCFPKRLKANF